MRNGEPFVFPKVRSEMLLVISIWLTCRQNLGANFRRMVLWNLTLYSMMRFASILPRGLCRGYLSTYFICSRPTGRPVVNGRRHHRRASVVEGVSPILSRSVSEKILDSRGAVLFLHVMVKRVQRQFRKYLLRPDVAFRRRKRKAEALAVSLHILPLVHES